MIKNWQTKYFEKTPKESHINIFRSLEIENYFKQLLKKNRHTLHSYKLNFSNSVIQIFISAYKKAESNKRKIVFKTRKTELLNKLKSRNILKTINHFTDNKFHLNLKFLNLNKHNQKRSKTDLKLFKLRISEIEQLSPIITNQHDSAKLLGTFIAEYLKTTKRHNFFFNSLSKSLNLILKQQNNRIKGIKILIKGRLNNKTRSRNRYIKIGSIPLITKNSNIDYSETTSYTPNGTIGIKIWICHKKSINFFKNEKTKLETSKTFLKNF